MKCLLFWPGLLLGLTTHAQEWFPPGASWTYGYNDNFLVHVGHATHTITGDSLVEGRNCRSMHCSLTYQDQNGEVLSSALFPDRYALYDSAGLVFVHVPGLGFDTLNVMDAHPGDRWSLVPLPDLCDSAGYAEVVDTGHVTIDGQWLRWLAVDRHFPDVGVPWVLPDTVVERLGSLSFLVPQVACPWWDMPLAGNPLRCYEDDLVSYIRPGLEACELNLGIGSQADPPRVQVRSGNGTLCFWSEQERLLGVELFSATGQRVRDQVGAVGPIVLDLRTLPAGCYIYRAHLSGGVAASGRLMQ